jgi:hypothetical protein
MRSNVYLSKSFLRYMIENKTLMSQQDDFELKQEVLNYQKVKNIISKSNLSLEYEAEEIKKIIQTQEESIEAKWLKSILKSEFDQEFNKNADYSKPYTIFLEDNINCIDESNNKNALIKGTNYNFKDSFFKSPLRTEFNKDMSAEDISNTYHLCKNIVLIDPYIFADDFKKSDSLFNFLESCFSFNNKQVLKYITIVSSFPTDGKDLVQNKKIEEFRKRIADKFNMNMENISVLRLLQDEFNGNRHLITDYALMDLQHILDREGVVSGLFLYNNDIDENFIKANKLIDKIKKLNQNYTEKHETAASNSLKHNRFKFGDISNNPLLN